jgi:hypothetical protein
MSQFEEKTIFTSLQNFGASLASFLQNIENEENKKTKKEMLKQLKFVDRVLSMNNLYLVFSRKVFLEILEQRCSFVIEEKEIKTLSQVYKKTIIGSALHEKLNTFLEQLEPREVQQNLKKQILVKETKKLHEKKTKEEVKCSKTCLLLKYFCFLKNRDSQVFSLLAEETQSEVFYRKMEYLDRLLTGFSGDGEIRYYYTPLPKLEEKIPLSTLDNILSLPQWQDYYTLRCWFDDFLRQNLSDKIKSISDEYYMSHLRDSEYLDTKSMTIYPVVKAYRELKDNPSISSTPSTLCFLHWYTMNFMAMDARKKFIGKGSNAVKLAIVCELHEIAVTLLGMEMLIYCYLTGRKTLYSDAAIYERLDGIYDPEYRLKTIANTLRELTARFKKIKNLGIENEPIKKAILNSLAIEDSGFDRVRVVFNKRD